MENLWYYSKVYKKYKNHYTGEIITEDQYQKDICSHDWEYVVLLSSAIYHCKKCGVRRSDKEN